MPSFGTTGRSLVLLAENAAAGVVPEALAGHPVVQVFPLLGVAVVDAPPESLAGAEAAPAVLAVEHERLVAAFDLSPDYLRGYRDAVEHLAGIGVAQAEPPTEESATWGLQAVRAPESTFSGAGVRVAVLDTGFDSTHPDFAGRTPVLESFVEGEEPADGNGHGTHCIGTALGPLAPGTGPRYGLAYDGEIYAGKVLSNAGSGSDTEILAGMEWALEHSCAVVSMSLGAPVEPGEPYSQVFEAAARRMQDAGTLIVAAAGNESNRPVSIRPVGHPANCPSILAVAALDTNLAVASFSNRGLNPDGGQIDIAGPGVDVYSSWPMPGRYRTLSGTSMATPHAAGVAALLAEANPGARGAALARLLIATARRLDAPSSDVGAGIVQAP
jgi:subtilisin family serine protease